ARRDEIDQSSRPGHGRRSRYRADGARRRNVSADSQRPTGHLSRRRSLHAIPKPRKDSADDCSIPRRANADGQNQRKLINIVAHHVKHAFTKGEKNMVEKKSSAMTLTLPSDREIVLTRVFDAPRRLVFEALTKPEHVKRWWGCRGSTVPICE